MAKKSNPKERIMAERGLVQVQPATRKRKRLVPGIIPNQALDKTTLMKYLEQKYGVLMEQVLTSASLSVVAKKLGNEVDVTTISKWIKKLNLRYTANNLPKCQGCRLSGPACEGGICYLLIELELYDLVPKMKEALLNGNTNA